MAEQLWKGRFSKAVDSRVNDFNSSIRFDQRMIAQDMRGSGVHAAMLAKQGIISEKDCEDILNGLASIADDLASGKLEIDPNAEDVHTFVEQTLTARIGDAGKRLHTGRSRNDQVALDIRLTLRDYSHTLQAYIVELIKVICKKAGENTTAVMPGYTHLQRAQPITFGHALMAYASMLLRDLQRFEDATARMDAQCPLGSGALAGTTYPLDRQFTAEKLGFAAPCANSLDGVSDRDFCIELANAISICMMHLSRLSEEIILWCSWEFKFIELDDAFTTGSSIMPQKKNPDVTELIRGKTGRVYGDLNTLLRKAIEQNAVHPFYVDKISSSYARRIEALDTVEDVQATLQQMIRDYCAYARRYSLKGYSPTVQKVINHINLNLSEPHTLKSLAALCHISPSYLSSLFKQETGSTLIDYINTQRVKRAAQQLTTTDRSISEVAEEMGILDVNYFAKIFKRTFGMTPTRYRRENRKK